MKKEIDQTAEEVFNKIRSRFEDVTLGDENAKATDEPSKARFFNFEYVDSNGKNFGDVTISIVDNKTLSFNFGREIPKSMDQSERKEWYKYLEEMRFFAMAMDLNWQPRDLTRPALKTRDLKTVAKIESPLKTANVSIGESRMFGSSRISYESLGSHRLIVKHSRRIDEERPGVRSRHIESIYIENQDGERFKSPSRSLTVSRALATHLAEGGKPYDEVYEGVCKYVDEMKSLGAFLRRSKVENYEDPEIKGLVKEATQEYAEGKNLLRQMARPKHYQECVSRIMEKVKSSPNEKDQDHLKNKFTKQIIDDRVTKALPTISKLYHQRSDAKKTLMDKQKWLFDQQLINEIARNISMYESAISYKSMEQMVEHVLENLTAHLQENGQQDLVEFADHWKNEYKTVGDSLEKQLINRFVVEVYRAAKALPKTEMIAKPKKDLVAELLEDLDDDIDVDELQDIFDSELKFGPNGSNAIAALEDILINDNLNDLLYKESKDTPDQDARPLIKYWLMDNHPEVHDQLDFEKLESAKEPEAETPEAPAEPPPPAPAAEPAAAPETPAEPGATPPAPGDEEAAMADLKKLAGI
jgi:hypothetical protein